MYHWLVLALTIVLVTILYLFIKNKGIKKLFQTPLFLININKTATSGKTSPVIFRSLSGHTYFFFVMEKVKNFEPTKCVGFKVWKQNRPTKNPNWKKEQKLFQTSLSLIDINKTPTKTKANVKHSCVTYRSLSGLLKSGQCFRCSSN